MTFDFVAPGRILFGDGRLDEAPAIVASLGARALVVQGGGDRAAPLVAALHARGIAVESLGVAREPTIGAVERAAASARETRRDVVVAIGGGSVIDAAKAIAALVTNAEPAREYLEVVGRGRPLATPPLPLIAIPTTAGTGAEATRNAVLLAEAERVKVSLRSPLMLPTVAILDARLTVSLPAAVTASTGLDALTQCIEPFVSPAATPLTDAVAREGMTRAARSIARAVHDPGDLEARRDMLLAALCSGMALANARLGAVHGFAAPLGGMFPIPHGVACARLLPAVARTNVRALRARAPGSPSLARYDEVARVLTGRTAARADDVAPWLADLVDSLDVPRLGTYGVTDGDIPRVVSAARQASSMKGNPIELSDDELDETLRSAL